MLKNNSLQAVTIILDDIDEYIYAAGIVVIVYGGHNELFRF